jgi:hypothetical protein
MRRGRVAVVYSFPTLEHNKDIISATGASAPATPDSSSSWETRSLREPIHPQNTDRIPSERSDGALWYEPLVTLERFSNFVVPLHLAARRSGPNEQDIQFDGDLWVPGDLGRIVRLTCPPPSVNSRSDTEAVNNALEQLRDDLCFLAVHLRDCTLFPLWGALAGAVTLMNHGNPLEPHHSAPLINLVARCVRGEVPPQGCWQMLNHISTDPAPLSAALRLEFFLSMLDQLPERSSDAARLRENVWNAACLRPESEAVLGASRFAAVLALYNSPSLLAKMRADNPRAFRAYIKLLRNAERFVAPIKRQGSLRAEAPESLVVLDSAIVDLLSSIRGGDHQSSNRVGRGHDSRDLLPSLRLLKSATEIVTVLHDASAEDRACCLALLRNGIPKPEVIFQLSLSLELGIPLSHLPKAVQAVRSQLQKVQTPACSQGTSTHQTSPAPSLAVTPLEVFGLRLNKASPGWQKSAENIAGIFLTIVNEGAVDAYKLSADFVILAGICNQAVGGEKIGRYASTLLNWAAGINSSTSKTANDFSSDLSAAVARFAHEADRGRRAIVLSRFLGALTKLDGDGSTICANADVLIAISSLSSGQRTECEELMTMAINAIKGGLTLSLGPELPGQLVKKMLPLRTKESLLELNLKVSWIMRLKFIPSLEINRLDSISKSLSFTHGHLQINADLPDSLIDSNLGEVTDLRDLGLYLEETKQHVLHWLAAPWITSFINATDPEVLQRDFNEIAATHDIDRNWPPLGMPAAATDVQTPKEIQNDVVHIWRLIADGTALREEKFEARRPTSTGQSNYTEFGRQVTLSSAPIEWSPEAPNTYPGPGVIYEGMDLDKILARAPRGESHLDPYRQEWPWVAEALPDSAEAVYIHSQAFHAVIPPRYDSAESRYTLFDATSNPIAHYSLLVLSDVRWNPAELGAYLVPTDRLIAMWHRKKTEDGDTKSFSITGTWRDSNHLLRFLRAGPAPVINLSDGCNLSGFHKSLPTHFFPFEEALKGGHRRRDSSGHLLLQSLSRQELARVLSEFNLDTQKLHDSVRDLALRCFNLLSAERLFRMKWHKGTTQIQFDSRWPTSHVPGVHPSAFMMLDACYQWHQRSQQGRSQHDRSQHQRSTVGDVSRDAFPVFTIGPTFDRRDRLKSMPIIDTKTMRLFSKGQWYQLRPEANAGEAREQRLWVAHIHSQGYKDDLLDYKFCDAEGFKLPT